MLPAVGEVQRGIRLHGGHARARDPPHQALGHREGKRLWLIGASAAACEGEHRLLLIRAAAASERKKVRPLHAWNERLRHAHRELERLRRIAHQGLRNKSRKMHIRIGWLWQALDAADRLERLYPACRRVPPRHRTPTELRSRRRRLQDNHSVLLSLSRLAHETVYWDTWQLSNC